MGDGGRVCIDAAQKLCCHAPTNEHGQTISRQVRQGSHTMLRRRRPRDDMHVLPHRKEQVTHIPIEHALSGPY
jgi:hypothetical protein